MACIIADIHGRLDRVPYGHEVVIMLGDSLLSDDDIAELSKRDSIFLLVNGNNDKHILNNEYPTVRIFNGVARKVSSNLYHLRNGDVFNIEGYKFWCMGGAESLNSRVLPTLDTILRGLDNLDGGVDYIITHDIPAKFYPNVGIENILTKNYLNSIFNSVYDEASFNKWYAGHHHVDAEIERLNVVYDKPIVIHRR